MFLLFEISDEGAGRIYAYIFLFFAICLFLKQLFKYFTTYITVENNEYFIETGFFTKIKIKMLLDKTQSIESQQGILGQLLKYKTVNITGIGGSNYTISYIKEGCLTSLNSCD